MNTLKLLPVLGLVTSLFAMGCNAQKSSSPAAAQASKPGRSIASYQGDGYAESSSAAAVAAAAAACICKCKIQCQRQSPPYGSYDALISGYFEAESGTCADIDGAACLAACPAAGGGGTQEGTLQGCKKAPRPLPVPGAGMQAVDSKTSVDR
jgi:hypothetical protein